MLVIAALLEYDCEYFRARYTRLCSPLATLDPSLKRGRFELCSISPLCAEACVRERGDLGVCIVWLNQFSFSNASLPRLSYLFKLPVHATLESYGIPPINRQHDTCDKLRLLRRQKKRSVCDVGRIT